MGSSTFRSHPRTASSAAQSRPRAAASRPRKEDPALSTPSPDDDELRIALGPAGLIGVGLVALGLLRRRFLVALAGAGLVAYDVKKRYGA
jgi:hypothetical protein